MILKVLTENLTIPRKKLLAVVLLVSTTLAWFFVFYFYFLEIFTELDNVLFLVSVAFSAVMGSVIAERVNRQKLLLTSTVIGILSTALLAFFNGATSLTFLCILVGASFGVALPSSWAFLADSTTVEERARVSGLAILTTFVIVIASFAGLGIGIVGATITCVAIRLIGSFSFVLDKFNTQSIKKESWRTVLGYKDFRFYLLAYIMFNCANGLVTVVWNQIRLKPDFVWAYNSGGALQYLGVAVFALISGIMADRIGRKKLIIFGMVLLGIGYMLIGLVVYPWALFIQMSISGFAWGIMMVIYLAVPGDLSLSGSRERFYVVSAIVPFVLYLGFHSLTNFLGTPPISYFSTILGLVLFASVIPVFYAQDTMPESVIRDREFEDHVKKVGKIIEESKKTRR